MSGSPGTTFRLRWERFGPEVEASLRAVYGGRAGEVAERVRSIVAHAHEERPEDLRILDERRLLSPDWLQDPRQVGYVAYADRFAGTLADIGEHLPDAGAVVAAAAVGSSARARATAPSSAAAAGPWSRPSRSIIAADSRVPTGLATPRPAMSGALPCTGS